jgi:hypothetical protein
VREKRIYKFFGKSESKKIFVTHVSGKIILKLT